MKDYACWHCFGLKSHFYVAGLQAYKALTRRHDDKRFIATLRQRRLVLDVGHVF